MGLTAFRKTLEDGYGYDIEGDQTKIRLLQEQVIEKPKRTWWRLVEFEVYTMNQHTESQPKKCAADRSFEKEETKGKERSQGSSQHIDRDDQAVGRTTFCCSTGSGQKQLMKNGI